MQVISVNQPGPLVAAAMWLSDDRSWGEDPRSLTSFRDFCSYFHDCWPDGDTYTATSYITLYLGYAFTHNRMLNEVFTIPATPTWLVDTSQSANIVILQKDQKGMIRELVLEPKALLPDALPLGFVASTTEDVLAWLNHEHFGAFCLCPSDCGAELIFVLKLDNKYVWVLLRTIGRGAQTLSEIDFNHEFEKLTEKGLFSNVVCIRFLISQCLLIDSVKNSEPLLSRLADAFNSLPNLSSVCGGPQVLRVWASFPSELDLSRDVAQRLDATPVATLNVKMFQSVTESFVRKDLIENLLSSMQDRRSQYTDEMFNSLNPT